MIQQEIIFSGLLLSTYILSFSLRYAYTYPGLTTLFSMLFSLLGTTILFGVYSALSVLVMSVLMCVLYNEIKVRYSANRVWTFLVWTIMMSWLTYLNIIRMDWNNPVWELHLSGIVMLMLIKYTSTVSIMPAHRISLMHWLGWTYFLPSFFVGPTLEIHEYIKWISQPPPPLAVNFEKRFLQALWYIPIAIIGKEYFAIDNLINFSTKNGPVNTFLFLWMAIFVIKCRFYFAWKLTEASYEVCGAGRCSFHCGRNVNITKVELASNAHELLSNWNICAAMWLKLHVYSPVLDVTHSPRIAIIVTNVVSALWHGLYPGYFLSFLFCGVLTAVCRSIRHNIDPLIPRSSPVLQCGYKLITTIWMCVVLHTAAIPFQLCSFPLSWKAWESINFIGHIWLLLALVLSLLVSQSQNPIEIETNKN